MRAVMFAPSTFGSVKNMSGLASPVSVPVADFWSGLVTVTVWAPAVAVLGATITMISIASVTIASCTAATSTVTTAFGSKFVPLITNAEPSEQIGSGMIDVIVGGGSFLSEEQPVAASISKPLSTGKQVDKRMVARE